MAWYNKYRPTDFDQVIGQELVKSVLLNSLSKNKTKHAYLFSGPKGIGKTTIARIFANKLNKIKENPESKIDIMELDAASNSSVDNIRQLIENAQTPPVTAKYKIYIIDEVHMLSKTAMNALLKILEEPPNYLIFLLATTNPEKIIPTVLSRLTKLNLFAHTQVDLIKNLSEISQKESLNIQPKALEIIAKRANGSQRDAINLLQTIASYELQEYSELEVGKLLGFLPEEILTKIAKGFIEGFEQSKLQELESLGLDAETFLSQLLDFLLNQSFSGQNDFDELILPLSEILSLRLNFGSLISGIALVQVKIRQNNNTLKSNFKNSIQKSDSSSKSDFETNSNLVSDNSENFNTSRSSKTVQKSTLDQEKNSTESLDSKIKEDSNLHNSSQKIEISLSKIQNLLSKIALSKSSPTVLKMVSADLELQKIEDKKLYLTTSNGIFLSQLNSAKLQKYILEEINKNLNSDFEKIKISLRNTKNVNLENKVIFVEENIPENEVFIKPSDFEPNIQEFSSSADNNLKKPKNPSKIAKKEDTLKEDLQNNSNIQNPEKENSLPKEQIENSSQKFYQVYNKLPENINPEEISVIKKPLPNPKPKIEKVKDWDETVEEMFDLE